MVHSSHPRIIVPILAELYDEYRTRPLLNGPLLLLNLIWRAYKAIAKRSDTNRIYYSMILSMMSIIGEYFNDMNIILLIDECFNDMNIIGEYFSDN